MFTASIVYRQMRLKYWKECNLAIAVGARRRMTLAMTIDVGDWNRWSYPLPLGASDFCARDNESWNVQYHEASQIYRVCERVFFFLHSVRDVSRDGFFTLHYRWAASLPLSSHRFNSSKAFHQSTSLSEGQLLEMCVIAKTALSVEKEWQITD